MTAPSSPHSRPRIRLGLALGLLALLAAVGWLMLTMGSPFPPRTIVMATGPAGSAQHEFGARYRDVLQRVGVQLELMETKGGVENLALLQDPRAGVSVAFVEAGLATPAESPDLASLGTVALEPFWIFRRAASHVRAASTVAQRLEGMRISIEPEGSATRAVARRFLALNRVDETRVELLGLTAEQGADALLRGEIDVAMMLTSPQSPTVHRLLAADGILLEGQARADAYVALFPRLTKLVLPTGVADLARNIPPSDVTMLAVVTNLAVRKSLHPALQYLLLEAATEIHGGPDVFHQAGRFPAAEAIDLPLTDQARQFYKSGRPFIYRHLPFWVASLAERVLIVLIPLFAVVFPIAQFLPPVYASVIERRIYMLYGELKLLEAEMERLGRGRAPDALATALQDLARRANHLRVPLRFSQRLFILKDHIALAQREVEQRRTAPRP